jgi:hypothetical protein
LGFYGWGGDCSGTGACDVTMSDDRTVTANFMEVRTITIVPTGTGVGRVTSTPAGINCSGSCSATVWLGASVTLTADPDANSEFLGWGGACSGGTVCKLSAWTSQTVWANFKAIGPPPVSNCAGIAAPDTPPVTQFVQYPWYGPGFTRGGAAADASGTLAFGLLGAHGDGIDFVSSSGTLLREGGTSMFGFPLQQPNGFAYVSGRPYLGPAWAILHGQMISDFDANGTNTGVSYFANYSRGNDLSAAADLLVRSLVITDGAPAFGVGNISAQWFDKDGASLAGEFVLLTNFDAGGSTWFETTPLIEGGLLVRRMDGKSHAIAVAVVESGTKTVTPPPNWMVSRRDARLQITRGGKAYAVLPLGASGVSCTQRVEGRRPRWNLLRGRRLSDRGWNLRHSRPAPRRRRDDHPAAPYCDGSNQRHHRRPDLHLALVGGRTAVAGSLLGHRLGRWHGAKIHVAVGFATSPRNEMGSGGTRRGAAVRERLQPDARQIRVSQRHSAADEPVARRRAPARLVGSPPFRPLCPRLAGGRASTNFDA